MKVGFLQGRAGLDGMYGKRRKKKKKQNKTKTAQATSTSSNTDKDLADDPHPATAASAEPNPILCEDGVVNSQGGDGGGGGGMHVEALEQPAGEPAAEAARGLAEDA